MDWNNPLAEAGLDDGWRVEGGEWGRGGKTRMIPRPFFQPFALPLFLSISISGKIRMGF